MRLMFFSTVYCTLPTSKMKEAAFLSSIQLAPVRRADFRRTPHVTLLLENWWKSVRKVVEKVVGKVVGKVGRKVFEKMFFVLVILANVPCNFHNGKWKPYCDTHW